MYMIRWLQCFAIFLRGSDLEPINILRIWNSDVFLQRSCLFYLCRQSVRPSICFIMNGSRLNQKKGKISVSEGKVKKKLLTSGKRKYFLLVISLQWNIVYYIKLTLIQILYYNNLLNKRSKLFSSIYQIKCIKSIINLLSILMLHCYLAFQPRSTCGFPAFILFRLFFPALTVGPFVSKFDTNDPIFIYFP